jgi:hypothetical protein
MKVRLSRVDVGWNLVSDVALPDLRQQIVALQATGEETADRIDGEVFDHLAKLLPEMVTLYEIIIVARIPAPHQQGIPGENQAAGSAGQRQQFIILYKGEVFHITPKDAQPAGQLTKHGVGDKARLAAQEIISGVQPQYMVFSVTSDRSVSFNRKISMPFSFTAP